MYSEKNLEKSSSGVISGDSKFHLNKTIAMVFSHRRHLDIQLTINNQPVKVEGRAKFLLLVFDSKLNWNELL